MARTYLPSLGLDIHQQAIYIGRYDSTIRAALYLVDPTLVPLYEAYKLAVVALNAEIDKLRPVAD